MAFNQLMNMRVYFLILLLSILFSCGGGKTTNEAVPYYSQAKIFMDNKFPTDSLKSYCGTKTFQFYFEDNSILFETATKLNTKARLDSLRNYRKNMEYKEEGGGIYNIRFYNGDKEFSQIILDTFVVLLCKKGKEDDLKELDEKISYLEGKVKRFKDSLEYEEERENNSKRILDISDEKKEYLEGMIKLETKKSNNKTLAELITDEKLSQSSFLYISEEDDFLKKAITELINLKGSAYNKRAKDVLTYLENSTKAINAELVSFNEQLRQHPKKSLTPEQKKLDKELSGQYYQLLVEKLTELRIARAGWRPRFKILQKATGITNI